ncbi:MAG: HEPN domain-containing protein [Dehalococcoidales bacterium]|nr:HEPN domain-containing protein [Dehalococcoidales bacterium]
MLDRNELKKLSKERILESEILYLHKKYDISSYLCGYAVELALKYRICKCLKWIGFPETKSEFEDVKFLKTHECENLLLLTGKKDQMKTNFMTEWSVVAKWNPDGRYHPLGTITKAESRDMIDCSKKIVGMLCGR